MVNCLNFEIRIKSSVFDNLKGTTVSPFVYAVFPTPDVYMEGAMCIKLITCHISIVYYYNKVSDISVPVSYADTDCR